MLRSKPTETLHVTIERHLKDKENNNDSVIGKSESLPDFSSNLKKTEIVFETANDDNFADQRRDTSLSKERSLSFFNFSVFKRTTSDGATLKSKAVKGRQNKKPLILPTVTLPKSSESKNGPVLRRSRSLTEVDG